MKKIFSIAMLFIIVLSCGNPISTTKKNVFIVYYDTMIEQSDTNKVKNYLKSVINRFYENNYSGSKLIIEAIPNRTNIYQERIEFIIKGKETETKRRKNEIDDRINDLRISNSGYNDIFTAISKLNIEFADFDDSLNIYWISDLIQKDDKYDFTQCNKFRLNSLYDRFNVEDADTLLTSNKLDDFKLKIKAKINVLKISNISDAICGTGFKMNLKIDRFWKQLFSSKINYNSI